MRHKSISSVHKCNGKILTSSAEPRTLLMSAALPSSPESVAAPRRIGAAELFVAFSQLALSGFGGVLPFAYRTLVEKRRWISATDFAGLLAMAQVMPGPTICNLSVMIGQRHGGVAGAAAALSGMIAGPTCIVLLLGIAWQHFGGEPMVRRALAGMSAVAIGLLLSTAVKMGVALFAASWRDATLKTVNESAKPFRFARLTCQAALCILAFAGVGLLRWPLIAVVAGLAPFAIALAWFGDAARPQETKRT